MSESAGTRESTMEHTHVVTIAEPFSPAAIDVKVGFDGAAQQQLDTRGHGATAQPSMPTKDHEPDGASAVRGFEPASARASQCSGQSAPQKAISALFNLVSTKDICDDHGAWGGTDWLRAEKDKINAIKDPNVRDAIFISHVQKEPVLDVRRTKRLLVTCFTSDSNGWSEPRGYWADWVRLEHGTEAPGNPQELLFDTIDTGIQKCRKFVCFLSPEYLKSWACLHELALAAKLQKDIVVVRVQDVGRISFEDVWKGVEKYEGQIGKAEVEAAVTILTKGLVWHIVDWSQLAANVAVFEQQVWPFLEAIDSDYADWDFHARLEVRCSEWMHGGKAKKLLLPRDEVKAASAWVMRRLELPKQRPQPSAEHLSFIAASEKKEKKRRLRQKQWYSCAFITFAVVAALTTLTIFFVMARQNAQENERKAVAEKLAAQASQAEAVKARKAAEESEARAVESEARAVASKAEAVRQKSRVQVNQLVSNFYPTANPPELALKVAASAANLSRTTSLDSDVRVMSILNMAINDFSRLLASRKYDLKYDNVLDDEGYLGSPPPALSQDGRWLASAVISGSGGIMLWDLKSASRQNVTLRTAGALGKVAFWDMGEGAGGTLLVAVDGSPAVLVWNLTSSQGGEWDPSHVKPPVQLGGCTVQDNKWYSQSLDISHTGYYLMVHTASQELCIWDFSSSAVNAAFMGDVVAQVLRLSEVSDTLGGFWYDARYASQGPYIILLGPFRVAVVKQDATAAGWEIAVIVDVKVGEHGEFLFTGSSSQVALSPDFQTLAVINGTSALVWKTSAAFFNAKATFGTLLLTLEQATGGAPPLVLPSPNHEWIEFLEFSPDGRYLRAIGYGNSLSVWDLYGPMFGRRGTNLQLIDHLAFEAREVYRASFSLASSHLITQSASVPSSETHLLAYTYVWDVSRSSGDGEVVLGRERDLRFVEITPDGRYLVSVDSVSLVKFHDVETGSVVGSIPFSDSGYSEVSFSPDGQHFLVTTTVYDPNSFVTVSRARVYEVPQVWDSSEGSPVVEVTQDLVNAQFSSTGAFLLGFESWNRRMLAVYRTEDLYGGLADPERIPVFNAVWVNVSNKDAYLTITAFACAPDDSYVAIACGDASYGLGDTFLINLPERAGAQGTRPYPTPVPLTRDHTGEFAQSRQAALAFSPTLDDGKQYLVTSAYDGVIAFWDVTFSTSAPSMAQSFYSQDVVESLAFSADGKFLAAGGLSGVEILGLACYGSSNSLQSFRMTSQSAEYQFYTVAFHRNASLPAKVLYGYQFHTYHVRTLDALFMQEHLSSIRSGEDVYSEDEIDRMTGVLDRLC